ncbi:pilO family protein [Burkholderia sp. WAC0059]|uniref:type 4b pilus protein PilO2 n=1 Tax=Burkholderia sp. WAC0059 TaxID=2066022 RepID=UPI000C7EAB49|nr:type 4b pilus protein PilO2 [Burkholderia sp. WAC0059]PLZ00006.1 pilO family protein [Burkholderia sp. WAC0059]
MAIHITEIGRHRFICGLFWQSLSRRHELRKEAVELSRQLNFDLMVLRIDRGAATVGFANRNEGARPGVSSLGAMVSKTIAVEGAYYDDRQQPAPNWLGAFKLPDGMWAYFAVRDGVFLPNGDWAGERDKVFDRLQADYALGGWNAVIGEPEIESHGYHNFYPRRIEDLFPLRNGKRRFYRWWRLQPVRRTLPNPMLIGVAAFAVVFTAASLAYWWHQREVAAELEAEMRANMRRPPPPKPALPHPWATQPNPLAFTEACLDAFSRMSAGGWSLDGYVCTPQGATYAWRRNGSTVEFLLAQVPAAQIDDTGDRATLTVPLALTPGGDEAIGRDAARVDVMNLFQMLGHPAQLRRQETLNTPAMQSSPGVPFNLGRQPPKPDWQTWNLNANLAGLSPLRVAAMLEQPGVRIDRLSWRNGAWTLEGEVYVHP